MKHIILVLNGLALVFVLGACSKKVTASGPAWVAPQDGGAPSSSPTGGLVISEQDGDGLFNEMVVDNPSVNVLEQVYPYTPGFDTKLQFGGWSIWGQQCATNNIDTTFFIETYAADGSVLTSDYVPWFNPIELQTAVNYGIRVRMEGVQGCRSATLSFTFSRVP